MGATAESTLVALEWKRFLHLAEGEARTETAKDLIREFLDPVSWAPDPATARLLQVETQEITPLLDRDALWGPLFELTNPDLIFESLRRGSVLEISDLVTLRRWLYAIDSWSQIPREEIRGERVRRALHDLPDPLLPLRILERVLTPEGELSERASPKLGALYSEIRSLKKEISYVLDHLLKTFSQKGILQENFSDVRDGRYVIPVKISNQGDVDGIIYEASASRQTVFVEPKEVAPLNNRLRQRQNDLIQEIYAVLEATSKQLEPFTEETAQGAAILAHWDAVQARARFGLHFGGKPITVTEDRSFILHQTAHPLLWWSLAHDKITRNEVDFGDPNRTLLLTGPNTGGKTVLLKTLGLAGICARTGFPFPGTDHPTVPFFDSFFADLGDPQSIEQHLSSFSGHIYRFKEILNRVTQYSLVLIDELNTATDPEEGAALGRAFLETVMSRGAMIISTTHDPNLKALAISDQRILNASMAFDETARTPTYRMITGVPGRSRALETAERLGMPEEVLELARKYISREHKEFEQMLSRLESDVQDAAKARKEAVHIREDAERLKKEWTDRTNLAVNDLLDKARQRLRRVVEQAQDEVRASVRKLDELKSRKDIDQHRGQINAALGVATSRIDSALEEEAPELVEGFVAAKQQVAQVLEEVELTVGQAVRIPKWKNTGTILEIKGKKVKVAMGNMQMSLSMDDIEPLSASETKQFASMQKPSKAKVTRMIDADRPSAPDPKVDLRGTRFDDAMSKLEHYLDQAYRSGAYAEVTVIHGLGSGALREGSRKLLAELPYIKEYRDGGLGQGGAGATIVEFDR